MCKQIGCYAATSTNFTKLSRSPACYTAAGRRPAGTHPNTCANGNITFLNRYALNFSAGKLEMMDSLTYIYAKDNNGASSNNGKMYNNRLYQVQDKQSVAARFATDIDDQGALSYALTYPTAGMPNTNLTALGSSNYQYDLTGQLVKDNAEKISNIKWTVYGKVSEVVYTAAANKPDLKFVYDATGNRVAKILRKVDKTADSTVQYYFRDAQGNPLDMVEPLVNGNVYTENHEYNLYGSSRVGTYATQYGFVGTNSVVLERVLGKRQYELSNHLGNVLTTITDQKYRVSTNTADYMYQPVVTSATDYFPFGMQIPGRTYTIKKYLYGFNGKEKFDAFSNGDYDLGERFYSSRIGKPFSLDPLISFYPGYSPYSYSKNNPIKFIDFEGAAGSDNTAAKFYENKPKIDMNSAPLGSAQNAAGYARNGPWFWRQMLKNNPEMFSPENIVNIKAGKSPVVDNVWIKYNSVDASYLGNKLVHHHIDQNNMAAGIPEKVHYDYFSELHPNLNSKSTFLSRVGGKLGKVGGILNFITFINVWSKNPHTLYNETFGAAANLNQLYYDTESEMYFKVIKRETTYDKNGNALKETNTLEMYNNMIYADGEFKGVDKLDSNYQITYDYTTKTQSAATPIIIN